MCGRLRIFKPNAAWHFPNEKIVLVKISKQGSSYWQFPPPKKKNSARRFFIITLLPND